MPDDQDESIFKSDIVKLYIVILIIMPFVGAGVMGYLYLWAKELSYEDPEDRPLKMKGTICATSDTVRIDVVEGKIHFGNHHLYVVRFNDDIQLDRISIDCYISSGEHAEFSNEEWDPVTETSYTIYLENFYGDNVWERDITAKDR